MAAPKPYHYNAELVRVVDGDTIIVNIDLGFDIILKNKTLRLSKIDSYESKINTRAKKQSTKLGISIDEVISRGKSGKEWLVEYLKNKPIIVNTIETDSFGRWLAIVYVGDEELNNKLLMEGIALEYE
jgi:micrococcal nuclease